MENAYSMALADMVDAKEVDYGDCKTFQIVCPNCHEAVFKGGGSEKKRDYFAHYPRSNADVAECERRVAAIPREAIQEWSLLRRGQTLKSFFALSQNIQITIYTARHPDKAKTLIDHINHIQYRPIFQIYIEAFHAFMRAQSHPPLPSSLDLIKISVAQNPTLLKPGIYPQERQMRFAADFVDYLTAPNSLPAFRFFIAFELVRSFLYPYQEEPADPFEDAFFKRAHRALSDLAIGKDRKFRTLIDDRDDSSRFGIFLIGGLFTSALNAAIPMMLDVIAHSDMSADDILSMFANVITSPQPPKAHGG